MFAIVKIAGQQFKVQEGQSLYVPHIAGKAGDKVEFSDVSLVTADDKLSAGKDAKAVVKAEIVNELIKGDKVIAFKMKRRKGFRKKHGHRTQYTQIKVTGISAGNNHSKPSEIVVNNDLKAGDTDNDI